MDSVRYMAIDETRDMGEMRGYYSQVLGLLRILVFVLVENISQEE